jgi:alkylated DNA repair protein (DNA oxidative demethylase)
MMQNITEQIALNFADEPDDIILRQESIAPGVVILRGYALPLVTRLLNKVDEVISLAPLRHMMTPGGHKMSVAMTSCGSTGWITDQRGYRYDEVDPLNNKPWPDMPRIFQQLATNAALHAGFEQFIPDSCLINRYQPGTKLSLHQDKNEKHLDAPIVSVSLGLPALFLRRADKLRRISLFHGDIAVWGGPARLFYHGIMPLKEGSHPTLKRYRYNLTLRKAR